MPALISGELPMTAENLRRFTCFWASWPPRVLRKSGTARRAHPLGLSSAGTPRSCRSPIGPRADSGRTSPRGIRGRCAARGASAGRRRREASWTCRTRPRGCGRRPFRGGCRRLRGGEAGLDLLRRAQQHANSLLDKRTALEQPGCPQSLKVLGDPFRHPCMSDEHSGLYIAAKGCVGEVRGGHQGDSPVHDDTLGV